MNNVNAARRSSGQTSDTHIFAGVERISSLEFNRLKSGYFHRESIGWHSSFLDLRSTAAGLRPHVGRYAFADSQCDGGEGSGSPVKVDKNNVPFANVNDLFSAIAYVVVLGLAEYLKVPDDQQESPQTLLQSLAHFLDDQIFDKFTHDEVSDSCCGPPISSSVLRGSCYVWEGNVASRSEVTNSVGTSATQDNGGKNNNAITDSNRILFNAHTDATLITLSLAEPGLEMLLPEKTETGSASTKKLKWHAISSDGKTVAQVSEQNDNNISISAADVSERGLKNSSTGLKSKPIICVFIGDFLDTLTKGAFAATPHRIAIPEHAPTGAGTCAGASAESSHQAGSSAGETKRKQVRHNFSYLLRPCDNKMIDTKSYPNKFRGDHIQPCNQDSSDNSKSPNFAGSVTNLEVSVRDLRVLLDKRGRERVFEEG